MRAIPITKDNRLATPARAEPESRGEQLVVASPTAAAWIPNSFAAPAATAMLWVSDADGARPISLSEITRVTRITLTDTDVTVSGTAGTTPAEQRIPIKLLPANAVILAAKNIVRCSATDDTCTSPLSNP